MSTATVETDEAINVESLLKQIEQLPRDEQLRLAQLIQERQPASNQAPSERPRALPVPDDKRERQWVKEHKHEYPGQWVALDGDRLIAASFDQMEVLEAARADGAYLPLIIRVPSPDDLPFMGI